MGFGLISVQTLLLLAQVLVRLKSLAVVLRHTVPQLKYDGLSDPNLPLPLCHWHRPLITTIVTCFAFESFNEWRGHVANLSPLLEGIVRNKSLPEAPKPYLPPVKVRMLSSTVGGFMPAGTASTGIRAIFPRQLPSWTLGDKVKKRSSRTNFNQLAPPCWRKVIKIKSRRNSGI